MLQRISLLKVIFEYRIEQIKRKTRNEPLKEVEKQFQIQKRKVSQSSFYCTNKTFL